MIINPIFNPLGYQTLDAGLTSLAGLTYASASFVKMTGADTFTLDTATYVPYTGATTAVNLNTQNLTHSGTLRTRRVLAGGIV